MDYDVTMDVNDDYLHVIVKGISSLPDNIDLQKKILKASKENQINRVLVDIRDLKNPTSITEVYQLSKEIGANLRNTLFKAAVLHGENRREHESFLETTMKNRGVNLMTFENEKDALDWLLE